MKVRPEEIDGIYYGDVLLHDWEIEEIQESKIVECSMVVDGRQIYLGLMKKR